MDHDGILHKRGHSRVMSKKIKVAVIGAKGFPARGGAARSNEEIYKRLVDRCDVTVYAMSTHAHQKDYHGIKQIIIRVPKHHWVFVAWYLFSSAIHALFFGKYDVVHVNHRSSGFIVPFMGSRYPVLLNIHGFTRGGTVDNKWNKLQRWLINMVTSAGVRRAQSIVTVEKSSVDLLTQLGGRRVSYIPNGVELTSFKLPEVDPERSYDIVFAAARIIPLKGLHDLINALNEMAFKGSVLIIGDLDQLASYKRVIQDLCFNLDCVFTGQIADKHELFRLIRSSKVFVFPSHSEGMSNMLLEVAALKVPIIASDIVQNTDVFSEDQITFFKCRDTCDLAEKIITVIRAYENAKCKANSAYERVINEYSWDDIAYSYYQVVNTLAKINA